MSAILSRPQCDKQVFNGINDGLLYPAYCHQMSQWCLLWNVFDIQYRSPDRFSADGNWRKVEQNNLVKYITYTVVPGQ